MSLDEVSMGERVERREFQGLRGQRGPETLILMKAKNHHGDPRAARGAGGKPGECGVHRPSDFKKREGTAMTEAAEISRPELRTDH